jgi:PPOX class probable F420-dependent enzyme
VSRRAQIVMTEEEIRDFLAAKRTMTCASIGPDGRPHLAPLWYVPDGMGLRCWTYGTSQKVRNLERLPQATLQVEDGEQYAELRGVTMECDVQIVRDHDEIAAIGLALLQRYQMPSVPLERIPPEVRAALGPQAAKRVGLCFSPTRVVSWDHRKLGGAY